MHKFTHCITVHTTTTMAIQRRVVEENIVTIYYEEQWSCLKKRQNNFYELMGVTSGLIITWQKKGKVF